MAEESSGWQPWQLQRNGTRTRCDVTSLEHATIKPAQPGWLCTKRQRSTGPHIAAAAVRCSIAQSHKECMVALQNC